MYLVMSTQSLMEHYSTIVHTHARTRTHAHTHAHTHHQYTPYIPIIEANTLSFYDVSNKIMIYSYIVFFIVEDLSLGRVQ